MELRPPPQTTAPPPWRRLQVLVAVNLVALAGIALALWLRPAAAPPDEAAGRREVAVKLQAAGALDEAAAQWSRYLETASLPAAERARIAFSLGTALLEAGRYEEALRWFYEAETTGGGELVDELAQAVVHSLERLGRHHAAEAAMAARVSLDPAGGEAGGDPVVARIGDEEIHRSRLERAIDEGPPEVARAWAEPARREDLLRQYVAEELLWRKARKLELDDDPEVRRRHAELLKQLVVSELVERELVAKLEVDETDLRTFYEANRHRYAGKDDQPVGFDEARPVVERHYRTLKLEEGYNRLIESELAAAGAELFPERLGDGP